MGPKTPDITKVMFEILHTLSIPNEIYMRREFGERYMNWIRFICSLLIINFCLGTLRFFHSLPLVGGGVYPQLSSYYWWGFIGLSMYHLFRIWQRNRRGITWHSYSFGISHFAFLGLSDAILYRWVEPLICITASLLIRPYSSFTANWILISAICLLIKNNYVFNRMRDRVLDVVDGRIEAAIMSGKLEGKSKHKTAGWSQIVTVPTTLGLEDDTDEITTEEDFAATVTQIMDQRMEEEEQIDAQLLHDAELERVQREQSEIEVERIQQAQHQQSNEDYQS